MNSRSALVICLAVMLTLTTRAQEACSALVEQSLATLSEVCSLVGRNQVCYGNLSLQITPQPTAGPILFQKPGDIADVAHIAAIRLSPMDTRAELWGIALMKLQANLPDTLPGQNVTLLLFGDTTLRVIEDAPQDYRPFQAFYVETGVGEARCAQAPPDGLLIQTPRGLGKVELTINGVQLRVGSILFVQAQRGDQMTIRVIEGEVEVTAEGKTQTVIAGEETSIPLNDDGWTSGPPRAAQTMSEVLPQTIVDWVIVQNIDEGPAGIWQSVDSDGSSMTMTILPSGEASFDFYLYDDGASICKEGDTLYPAEATAVEGRFDDGALSFNMVVWCLGPQPRLFGEFSYVYRYDAATDTIREDDGIIWTRVK